jgi:hypothetical protein
MVTGGSSSPANASRWSHSTSSGPRPSRSTSKAYSAGRAAVGRAAGHEHLQRGRQVGHPVVQRSHGPPLRGVLAGLRGELAGALRRRRLGLSFLLDGIASRLPRHPSEDRG